MKEVYVAAFIYLTLRYGHSNQGCIIMKAAKGK